MQFSAIYPDSEEIKSHYQAPIASLGWWSCPPALPAPTRACSAQAPAPSWACTHRAPSSWARPKHSCLHPGDGCPQGDCAWDSAFPSSVSHKAFPWVNPAGCGDSLGVFVLQRCRIAAGLRWSWAGGCHGTG